MTTQEIPPEYVKLPGSGFLTGRTTSSRLWLARDHLLDIETAGFSESYKRFYYRDIQALVIRKSERRLHWNIGLLCCFAFFVLIGSLGFSTAGNMVGHIICLSIGGLAALGMLINGLLGPTCEVHLKTRVQLEALPSLKRMRTVKKTLQLLKPRILEGQGSLPVEGVQAQLDQAAHQATQPHPPLGAAAAAREILKPYTSRAHRVLFILLMADGLLNLVHIFDHSSVILLLGLLTSLSAFGAVIVAIVKQYQTDLSQNIRSIAWGAAIYLSICFFVGYIESIVIQVQLAQATRHSAVMPTQWDILKKVAEIAPLDTPWLLTILVLFGMCALGLGAFGLLLLRSYRSMPAEAAEVVLTPPPAPLP